MHWLCPIEDWRRLNSSREGMLEGFSLGSYLLLVEFQLVPRSETIDSIPETFGTDSPEVGPVSRQRRNLTSLSFTFFIFRVYQPLVMGVGSPTLMKNLAKNCERCSRYGDSNLNLFAPRSTTSVSRKVRGTVWTPWKSTIRCSVVISPSWSESIMNRFHT